MAKGDKLASAASLDIQLGASGDHVAAFSDVFTVATESEGGMVTLTFYQSEIQNLSGATGTRTVGKTRFAKFITRVVINQQGLGVLLEALVSNQVTALGSPKGKEQS